MEITHAFLLYGRNCDYLHHICNITYTTQTGGHTRNENEPYVKIVHYRKNRGFYGGDSEKKKWRMFICGGKRKKRNMHFTKNQKPPKKPILTGI